MDTMTPAELNALPYQVYPLQRAARNPATGPEYVTGYLTPPDGDGAWDVDADLARFRAALPAGWSASWLDSDPGDTRIVVRRARPRVARIIVRCSTADIRRALYAAVSPFGSLSTEIADLAIAYLDDGCSVGAGIALLRATRADCPAELLTALTSAGEWSEVLLGGSRVQLITPTSGTVIELLRRPTGGWSLGVDFGEAGSDHRAAQILEHGPALLWQIEYVAGATIAQPDSSLDSGTMPTT